MDTEGEAFIIANMIKAEINGETINTQRNLGLESKVSSFEDNDRPATHMIAHNSPSPSPQKHEEEGVACSSISLYKDDEYHTQGTQNQYQTGSSLPMEQQL